MRTSLIILFTFLGFLKVQAQQYKYILTDGWSASRALPIGNDSIIVVGRMSKNLQADYMKHRWHFTILNTNLDVLKTDSFHLDGAVSTTFHNAFTINKVGTELHIAGGVQYSNDSIKSFVAQLNSNLEVKKSKIITKGHLHYNLTSLITEDKTLNFSVFLDDETTGSNGLLSILDSSQVVVYQRAMSCNSYPKYGGCNLTPKQVLQGQNKTYILAAETNPTSIPYNLLRDGLIMKVDSTGEELWRINLANDSTTYHNLLIAPLANGNYLATWHNFYYKPFKSPNNNRYPETNANSTVWCLEFDDSGNQIRLWNLRDYLKHKFNHNFSQFAFQNHLIITRDSGILIVGITRQNVAKYIEIGYALKLDKSGNVQWYRKYLPSISQPYTGKETLYINGVTELDNGNYALAGEYRSDPSDSFPTGTVQGIVLFVDSFGCLEPGCQLNDNIGIDELKESHAERSRRVDFTVYPNPSNGVIQIINSKSQAPKTIAIYDMQGRPANFVQHGTSFTLDCPAGIYYVRLVREDGYSEVHKFVIE